MHPIIERIQKADWETMLTELHQKGFTLRKGWFDPHTADQLKALYNLPAENFRKTVDMERYRFGKGQYKYFCYPLPAIIEAIRKTVYPLLVPLANSWNRLLKIEHRFPAAHDTLLDHCRQQGQLLPTPLILKYADGGFNTLHQDLYGKVYFPFQMVFFLSEPGPGQEYTGGEFVLQEQIPRAQSQATVLQPRKGDVLIFTTQFRPVLRKGSTAGYFRVMMKHGVSKVTTGERYTLGIIFHDAQS